MLDDRLKTAFILAKGLSVLLMIDIHSIVVLSVLYHGAIFTPNFSNASIYYYAIGFYTLCLPILAGSLFRISMDTSLIGGRVIAVDWSALIQVTYLLFLIEGMRAFFYDFSLSRFFCWTTLHSVGVSFLVIAFLVRRSIGTLVGVSVFVLVLTPWIHHLLELGPISPERLQQLEEMAAHPTDRFILAGVYAALSGFFVSVPFLFRKKLLSLRTILIVVVVAVVAFFKLAHEFEGNPVFFSSLASLPAAVWTGAERGEHMWPLLNWFPEIAFGFVFMHFLLQRRSKSLIKIVYIISLTATALYFACFFREDFAPNGNPMSLFTIKMFNISPISGLGLMAFFSAHILTLWMISPRIRLSSRGVIALFSKTILYVYFFHTVFIFAGARILHWAGVSLGWASVLLLILTVAASYLFARLLTEILDDKDFLVT